MMSSAEEMSSAIALRAAVLEEVRAAGAAGLLRMHMTCMDGYPPPMISLRLLSRSGLLAMVPSSPKNFRSPKLWVLPEFEAECRDRVIKKTVAPEVSSGPVVPERTIHYERPALTLPAGHVSVLDPRQCRPWAAAFGSV